MYNDKVIKALKSFDVYYKNENIKFSELEKRLFVEQLINDGILTIEHVMPQTLTNDWKHAWK